MHREKKGEMAFNTGLTSSSEKLLILCKSHKWSEVSQCVSESPSRALETIIMENNNSTSLLHQVITSKSNDMTGREKLIMQILNAAPSSSCIPNGYGSLPLHVVTQRNIKMDAVTKENVIRCLIHAYPDALLSTGGIGKRTPLHIAFTDYLSFGLINTMVQMGKQATAMSDKNGWLPIHVACSRHCSPEKLLLLLNIYPESFYIKTNDGDTPMSLATSTATSSHPNHKLIKALLSFEKTTSETTTLAPQISNPREEVQEEISMANPVRKSRTDIATQRQKRQRRHQVIHRNLHSDEDREHALNLLLLQSGSYLDMRRFSTAADYIVPYTMTLASPGTWISRSMSSSDRSQLPLWDGCYQV